ncbi:MAG: cysteine hydrolase family protein [Candidatus Omnitrophota bacterium]
MEDIVFFDIDTQYDFMNKKGALYVPKAERLIPNLSRLIRFAKKNKIPVLSSVDAHLKNDREFRQFPAHCVSGSRGARKIVQTTIKNQVTIADKKFSRNKLAEVIKGKSQVILEKKTFSVFTNPNTKAVLGLKKINMAYVFGVALDYCVKNACLGLLNLGIKTYLVKDAARPVDIRKSKETIASLRKRGLRLITTRGLFHEHRI